MNPIEFIQAKRDGQIHSPEALNYWIHSYARKEIPDYQMAAWLMAVYLKGMTSEETGALTSAMVTSGEVLDLGDHFEHSADKHSTGGVGDKTSLITIPLAAACGVKVAKMSGRGLGHTGGTVDKLESIPGLRTSLTTQEFMSQLEQLGLVISGQTADLAPADKLIYALRDVTATIEAVPLIASSIMSKKIAAGAKNIVLDVKYGQGAFMKTVVQAVGLAKAMAHIGEHLDRRVVAYVTDMNQPLGLTIGNALEVGEAVETLKGNGPQDLLSVSSTLAAEMVSLARKISMEDAIVAVRDALQTGKAVQLLKRMIIHQGGTWDDGKDLPTLPVAPVMVPVNATQTGYLAGVDALAIGRLAMGLGAGRMRKEDDIDPRTGVVFRAAVGDFVREGEVLATIHARSAQEAHATSILLNETLSWNNERPQLGPLIYARVTAQDTEYYSS